MRKIIYIIVFFTFLGVFDAGILQADSSAVQLLRETGSPVTERRFDDAALEKAKSNPDYQYDINRSTEAPSWLDKIMYKIMRFLVSVLINPSGSVENIVFYVICIALILLLVFVIMRMNSIGLFARRSRRDGEELDFSEFTEDINTIDFDKMIEEAVSTGMYRRAVRLHYLRSLKLLSDKNKIVWEINKTNRDYYHELSNPQLRSGFEEITYVYEYVWYGNVEIDADKFFRVRTIFNQFSGLTATVK